jgi:hypothetical protein
MALNGIMRPDAWQPVGLAIETLSSSGNFLGWRKSASTGSLSSAAHTEYSRYALYPLSVVERGCRRSFTRWLADDRPPPAG